jgi:hypothetical protein
MLAAKDRRMVARFAEAVGSRFRAEGFPSGESLPENDSRPLWDGRRRPSYESGTDVDVRPTKVGRTSTFVLRNLWRIQQ